MKAKKGAVPMYATFDELCALRRDGRDFGGRWGLMTDTTTVWLSDQRPGKDRAQSFEIPRSAFNQLLRWYINEQIGRG